MTFKLYIANKRYSTWSMRTWVLMKALDIPFEEDLRFFTYGLVQPTFNSFSPTGKVPTLYDGEDVIVHDSLAIAEYLAEDYPSVWPRDRNARAWARCASAEMHSGFMDLRDECAFNVAVRIDLGGNLTEGLQKDLDRLSKLWDEGLDRFGGPWLAGREFTAVDAMFAPVAVRVRTYGLELTEPSSAYAKRLLAHPAVAQWIDEGQREKEREPVHEDWCFKGGRKLVEDLTQY